MVELLCHFIGDFGLQNHAMAVRKTSSSKWAAIHVAFYSAPFLFAMCSPFARFWLPWSPGGLAVIAGTHFVIDRFRLAGYWVRFWGIGVESRLTGPIEPAPPSLATVLAIVVDNTIHLTINHLALPMG